MRISASGPTTQGPDWRALAENAMSAMAQKTRMRSNTGSLRPYDRGMKTSYLFGAILLCSIIGTLVGARSARTALLVTSGVLSAYGLFRMLG